MKAAINNTLIKALPEGPVDIRDSKLTGFVLRVRKSGRASYRVQYARGKWYTIGRLSDLKPAEAREQALKILGEAAKGNDPAASRKRRRAASLRQYLDTVYRPWLESHRKYAAATLKRLYRNFDADMGGKRLPELTPWLVEKWRSQRLKAGRRPGTVNRDIAELKSALSKAVEWGYLDANPLAKVKPIKMDRRAEPRYLTAEENDRLREALRQRDEEIRAERRRANQWRRERDYPTKPDLDALPFVDHLHPLILLALNTGMRRGELFNLQWQDVDTSRARLTVQGGGAKSGQTRHIPLNAEALAVLDGWRVTTGRDAGLVFPGRDGGRLDNIAKGWKAVVTRAGLSGFRFHDLRHTFASWLVMQGVDLYAVRDLLGHSTIAMTERYAHLAPEHKAGAVASLAPPARDKGERNG